MTPAARRRAVAIAQEGGRPSRRRARRLVGIPRSVVERGPWRARGRARLRGRLCALAGERRRFGYRRPRELLRREGWRANRKLVRAAESALDPYGEAAGNLRALARFVIQRDA